MFTPVKYKNYTVCADCSDPDTDWVIVNRGLFICDTCCSIHRSLGQHISQIKSLSVDWYPVTFNMVKTLHKANVNTFWEHALSDNKNQKKKPTPNDQFSLKRDFIHAKHGQQSFILKSSDTRESLSQQLHSSVRTSNIETSLRILAQGADFNYYHPGKESYPLHVAAKEGQILQVELLLTYGANPCILDSNGNTPAKCAKLSGHNDIKKRLNDSMYEVLDAISMYVFGRKADHKNGEHKININLLKEFVKNNDQQRGIKELQKLPIHSFEDLVSDVFDEIGRRDLEIIWRDKKNKGSVLFLPINPKFTKVRNQERQKLASFREKEFKYFGAQILIEINRRTQPPVDNERSHNNVPNEDNYVTTTDEFDNALKKYSKPSSNLNVNSKKSSINHELPKLSPSNDHAFEVKSSESETKASELTSEIDLLKKKIEEVTKENAELKFEMLRQIQPSVINDENDNSNVKQSIRTVSVDETRERMKYKMNQNIKIINDDAVKSALRSLNTNVTQLQLECASLDAGIERVRNFSFNIEKIIKQLIEKF